eukprot:4275328-Prymnesium_polylepis.1
MGGGGGQMGGGGGQTGMPPGMFECMTSLSNPFVRRRWDSTRRAQGSACRPGLSMWSECVPLLSPGCSRVRLAGSDGRAAEQRPGRNEHADVLEPRLCRAARLWQRWCRPTRCPLASMCRKPSPVYATSQLCRRSSPTVAT